MTPPTISLTMDNSTQLNLIWTFDSLSNAPGPVQFGSAVQVCKRYTQKQKRQTNRQMIYIETAVKKRIKAKEMARGRLEPVSFSGGSWAFYRCARAPMKHTRE